MISSEGTDGVVGWVVALMEALGAPGVGVAIAVENVFPPLPSEVFLPLAGFAAARGEMSVLAAIAWTTLGSLVGALVLYGVGAALGRRRMFALADRMPLVDVRDVQRAEAWFARYGAAAVFLIAAELARLEVGGLSVTADLVAATSETDAQQKAAALAAGGPAAEALFANQDPATGTAAKGRIFQAVTEPDAAATALFGTPEGSVVSFQPNPQQSTWIVFKVVDRRTDVASSADAVNSISQSQLVAIGERLLQPVADEVGVRVNPRYGVWDPIHGPEQPARPVPGGGAHLEAAVHSRRLRRTQERPEHPRRAAAVGDGPEHRRASGRPGADWG